MNRTQLIEQIKAKRSFLCIGLDTDLTEIPSHLLEEPDPIFAFNRAIIESTRDLCVSYKINTAFYEAEGERGWVAMRKTLDFIGRDHLVIADAKRGDIGNTSEQYARAFFETLSFDAITVAPYMGSDSIKPFLKWRDKWAVVLGLTSNEGAADFELQPSGDELLYERVLRTAAGWGTKENTMFVIGATRAEAFANVRRILPDHFLLVPGVGAQGGSLTEVYQQGSNREFGLLVNVSRAVIYASAQADFAAKARAAALVYQQEMAVLLG
ncbi:MAG: orotidine-5'-phosphate decarboxylase [Bacteroidetes bacterium]|nr:orotidine-5'-phosphate decarboxylase [Bacteroidota bacterium]